MKLDGTVNLYIISLDSAIYFIFMMILLMRKLKYNLANRIKGYSYASHLFLQRYGSHYKVSSTLISVNLIEAVGELQYESKYEQYKRLQ